MERETQRLEEKKKLRQECLEIWHSTERGRIRLTIAQKERFLAAYMSICLPTVADYDLYQWVEDGLPEIF